jgi:hypothetical protein
MNMSNLHQAALDYNAMGWPIFRLQPRGKTPIGGTRGRDDATTDTILINRWWTELPTLNIGLATGDESGFLFSTPIPIKAVINHCGGWNTSTAHYRKRV